MKNNFYLLFALVISLTFSASCSKSELDNEEGVVPVEKKVIPPDAEVINFSISLSPDDGKATIDAGVVTWTAGDQVTVYGIASDGSKQFQTVTVSNISDDGRTAGITTDELSPGLTYYAAFPKCETATISDDVITVSEPSASTAQTNSNNQVAVAKAVKTESGYSLQFRNVNHLLKFTVSDDLAATVKSAELVSQASGSAVSYDKVSFNFSEGTSASAGSKVTSLKRTVTVGDNYIALAPGLSMDDGFCLKLLNSSGKVVKLFFLDSKFTTARNKVNNISNFETRLYNNLSVDETSNCYLINSTDGTKFCFYAKTKGNGVAAKDVSPSYANPDLETVDVLYHWSTLNTTTAPASAAAIISGLTYHASGYASFDKVNTGNVVVVAKNSSNDIIWSWHLWLPIDKVENVVHDKSGATMNKTNMLNANLGALKTNYVSNTDVRDLGFFYQWGRKDPFVSATTRTISDPKTIKYVAVHGAQKTFMNRGTSKTPSNNLAFVIANPTAFMVSADASGEQIYTKEYKDWYGSSTHYPFWALEKTMYDPCPPGYKVPRVQTGPWGYFSTGAPWDSTKKGRSFTNTAGKTIWHPAAGFLHRCSGKYSGSVNSLGVNGGYWGTDDDAPAADRGYKEFNYFWFFDSSGCAFNYDQSGDTNAGRATGRSVRCCRADEFL